MASRSNKKEKVWIDQDGRIHVDGGGQRTGGTGGGSTTTSNGGGSGGDSVPVWFIIVAIVAAIGLYKGLTDSTESTSSTEMASSYVSEPVATPVSTPSLTSVQQNSSDEVKQRSGDLVYPDSDGWVTLTGTLRRSDQTTNETGMGWARVVYFLDLDRRTTIVYTDGFGNSAEAEMETIAIEVLELYGDDANQQLASAYDSRWDQFVGMYGPVTGQVFDSGNAHTVGPVMLVNARAV